ncbi:MAG: DUF1464 domain-containing protein [Methanophagales archaeon ANME-1-THS]|nr:MAG: DUF1464 domain-containing protein [Methanophagales archaeon ANME-1-THS]
MSIMSRVLGIDPGTSSWDLVGLEHGHLFFERSLPTSEVKSNPRELIELLESLNLDVLVAPSGYGLPLKKVKDLTSRDLRLIALKRREDTVVMGLSNVLELLKRTGVEAYILPGVKHLPSVPEFRKINKIDMGTPDKVCTAALAIAEQATRLGIDYDQTSFILVELGSAFNAVLAIKEGKIVDGIGGTLAQLGFSAAGRMDGELAYLLGGFDKEHLYRGGVKDMLGKNIQPEELLQEEDTPAFKAYIEGIAKDVAEMRISLGHEPLELLISGKLAYLKQVLSDTLSTHLEPVRGFARVKHAAQGAALIADGLAGGRYANLIECLGLKECRHSSLDFIYLSESARWG